ncbi:C4b-binding protein alpha chain-like [Protopterus annectens]|uniref:C4b-binding protein alpha chain-like n=1 Tax=Protopterus annectens TaxID=7888 RepID=UPI001CFB211C|nr:C4b-binding protein alpha chain-like [Protopterus annectens]
MAGWKIFLVSCFIRVGIVSVLGDCGEPPKSEMAVVDGNFNEFPVNTILSYSCRPGYIWDRSSNKTVICQEDSKWTELKITCTPKSCGPLEDIQNGVVVYSNSVHFGSVAEISCKEGYNIVGRNQRVCLVNGWDHQNPVCEPVICDAPPEIADGTVDWGSGDITVASVATYKCKKNFHLIGNATIYCTKSGSWSGSPPICKDVKCPDPHVANGEKTSNFLPPYSYLESIEFKCDPGYLMTGPLRIVCKEDNNWDPSPPTCERGCGNPPISENAVLDSDLNAFPVNTTLTYSCRPGYIWDRSSSNQTICQENSRWTELKITCAYEGDNEKKKHIIVAVCITVAVIILLAFILVLIWCLKKKDGGSYKTTEEKVGPAPSVNTSSQQYSALQNKEASI